VKTFPANRDLKDMYIDTYRFMSIGAILPSPAMDRV
jgi:hypothetical protein